MVNISWTPRSGTFDLKHYRVELCINRACSNVLNTTGTSVEMPVSLSTGDMLYVQVSAESECGDVGDPGRSDVTTIQFRTLVTFCKLRSKLTFITLVTIQIKI